ncbi:MAG: hypothetical protein HRT47_03100 [Candidatus Caenarcaniphilales bacterium]|nr:hypothetical protein [Candidatus Caenarcaniphilales bacterium]
MRFESIFNPDIKELNQAASEVENKDLRELLRNLTEILKLEPSKVETVLKDLKKQTQEIIETSKVDSSITLPDEKFKNLIKDKSVEDLADSVTQSNVYFDLYMENKQAGNRKSLSNLFRPKGAGKFLNTHALLGGLPDLSIEKFKNFLIDNKAKIAEHYKGYDDLKNLIILMDLLNNRENSQEIRTNSLSNTEIQAEYNGTTRSASLADIVVALKGLANKIDVNEDFPEIPEGSADALG